MEEQVTAIEMRRKFGGILDRVTEKGAHITIMRGNRRIATLVPADEHERQCLSQDRVKRVEEVLVAMEAWQKKNPTKVKKMARENSVEAIRKMRNLRWSSSTRR